MAKQGDISLNGIYSVTFRGTVGWGIGLLVLRNGRITGVDVGGVCYDGQYRDWGSVVDFDITMIVPPGATLVQGTAAKANEYKVSFPARISKQDIENNHTILLDLPQGPVNCIFNKLRTLDD